MTARYAKITTTVSEQRLGKHVFAETSTHVTIDLLWKQGVFCVFSTECYGQDSLKQRVQYLAAVKPASGQVSEGRF
jgi:hypothetical protein